MATKLEDLVALVGEAEAKRNALSKLAAQQTAQPTVFQSGQNKLKGMFGQGSPEQARVMLQMLGSKPQAGETRMDGWSRGLMKGMDLRDQVAEAKHQKNIAAGQIDADGAQAQLKNMGNIYGLEQSAEQEQYKRAQMADNKAYDRGKKGTLTYGGKVYQTDAQGNVIGLLGNQEGPKPFTISDGQGRYDEQGNLIVERNAAVKGPAAKRYGTLQESAATRRENIEKATKFLDAFTSGAESGTSRSAAKLIPGIYTDQGAFDQELDSFAEEAARAALKAAGEIRPTDADVKGMKEAMFGVGKDEPVNINLLLSYLNKQVTLENEQRALEGVEPMQMPTGQDRGDEWYQELFGNTATGHKSAAKTVKW
jgi:hypothetical protein